MRKTLRVSLLIVILACSAHAGIMPNGEQEPPPPPQPTQSEQEPEGGDMPNGEPETATQTVLTLLGSVLSLF